MGRRGGGGYGLRETRRGVPCATRLGLALLLVLLVGGYYGLRWVGVRSPVELPAINRDLGGGRDAARPGVAKVDRFWVEPDDGVAPLLQQIDSAGSSLDVVVYLLTNDEIVDRLISAHGRGVAVRVMVEEDPFGGGSGNGKALKQLRAAGVPWKYGNRTYRYTHEKAAVIDGKRAIVSTANFTTSAFTRNREYLALISSGLEVKEIEALFDADWDRTGYKPHVPSLVVSDVNSRDRLLATIKSARKSLDTEAEVMADPQIRAALVDARRRGVRVRVVMSTPDREESSYEGLTELAEAGVLVRTLDYPYVHAKSVLVDRKRAYVGSINFTATSMDQNRELGLLTTTSEVIGSLGKTFDKDWSEGEQFPQESR